MHDSCKMLCKYSALLSAVSTASAEALIGWDGTSHWEYEVVPHPTQRPSSRAFAGVSPPIPPDPVGDFDFPDPAALHHDGVYYAFGGNMQMHSTDLATWSPRYLYLDGKVPAWAQAGSQPGAPSAPVQLDSGGWAMYFQMPQKDCHRNVCSCVGAALAAHPGDAFVPAAEPVVCAASQDGAIDASGRRLADGTLALFWKTTGYNSLARPARLWGQLLDGGGTSLIAGSPAANLLNQTEEWEASGGVGCAEAPAMVQLQGGKRGNRSLLLYSGGDWTAGLGGLPYSVGYAACDTALGPCSKVTTDARGGPWLGPEHNGAVGVGGQEFFLDEAGAPWLVFHGWKKGRAGYPRGKRTVRFYPLSALPEL